MTARRKLLLAAISTAVISLGGYLIVASLQSQRQAATARVEIRNLVEGTTIDTSAAIMRLIAAQDETLRKEVDGQLNVVRQIRERAGPVSFSSELVNWNATNQYTLIPVLAPLPKMLLGGRWLGRNSNPKVKTMVVDDAKKLVGGTMTIFQRMNARGDMLRVATNVETDDGRRAIGTYVPSVDPDGSPNAVISTVLAGRTFRGAAWVVNAYYVADYEPLRDSAGHIVGMLYAGDRQESGSGLRAAISRATVGKTGDIIVLALKGEKAGRCLISRDERNGRDLSMARDVTGEAYGAEILAAARTLKEGESVVRRYTLGTRVNPMPIVARVTRYAPWDWAVVAEAREADFAPVYARLRNNGQAVVAAFLLFFGGTILITLPLMWAEATERRSREAERASRAKSEFLSRMSHELRTPMNAILGFAQILQLDNLSEDQADSVSHIRRAGEHLLRLINEVLDISRIEAGATSISLEAVSILEVANEVSLLVKPMADQRAIDVRLNLRSCEHAHVTADRQRLLQVVLNLASNAVKFNVDGGSVEILAEKLPDNRIRIAVADTGKGIDPDRASQLFTPFERLGAEQSQIEGTGLGLALSKRLVEAMGGAIGFRSGRGGATFFVDFAAADSPVAALAESDAEVLRPVVPPVRRHTVLLIEDNLSNVHLIEKVLAAREGTKLLVAMQGTIGYELAVEHRPDLILLDLNLPDVHGHDVLVRIRGNEQLDKTAVVVLSADATEAQVSRLIAAGARGYLTKPLDLKAFMRTMDDVLNGDDQMAA